MAQTQAPQPSLLGIPPELRLNICEHLFPPDMTLAFHVHINAAGQASPFEDHQMHHKNKEILRMMPTLALVNQQIASESLDFFWSNIKLRIVHGMLLAPAFSVPFAQFDAILWPFSTIDVVDHPFDDAQGVLKWGSLDDFNRFTQPAAWTPRCVVFERTMEVTVTYANDGLPLWQMDTRIDVRRARQQHILTRWSDAYESVTYGRMVARGYFAHFDVRFLESFLAATEPFEAAVWNT
ncbi:hypothetical protein LTR17_000050 [Elasticomyces elasticus]|nr:hypothetical protein LTR17_000050 [Elasticomyces elasticus]